MAEKALDPVVSDLSDDAIADGELVLWDYDLETDGSAETVRKIISAVLARSRAEGKTLQMRCPPQ